MRSKTTVKFRALTNTKYEYYKGEKLEDEIENTVDGYALPFAVSSVRGRRAKVGSTR
jgi:hypothetical protein